MSTIFKPVVQIEETAVDARVADTSSTTREFDKGPAWGCLTPTELAGMRVLVAEDNAIIALDLQMTLEDNGALVYGPFSTVSETMNILAEKTVDCALVDLDLGGESALPILEMLMSRGVPTILATGHDISRKLPPEFSGVRVLEKPFTETDVVSSIKAVLPQL